MTMRTLVAGALGAAVALTMFAASDAAFAAKRKQGGGAGICISVPAPDCNFFLRPVCTKKSACGGCLKWACTLGVEGVTKKK